MDKTIRITCDTKLHIPLNELIPCQKDLKEMSKASAKKLAKSILSDGIDFNFTVWRDSSAAKWYLIDGHGRDKILRFLVETEGWTCPAIPCVETFAASLKEAKRKILRSSSTYHKMTKHGLYEFATDLGMSPDEMDEYELADMDVDAWKDEYYNEPEVEGQDAVPEPPKKPNSKLGDLYLLGEHRILCGDSTDSKSVERLFDGEKACVWSSDPPYGINHVEVANEKNQAKGYSKIQNDELQDQALQDFIFKVIDVSKPHMKKGFAFYMWHAMKMQAYFSQAAAAAAAGILFHRQIIWVKPQFVFGRGQYHWRHELCLMGWLQGNMPPFYAKKNQSTVWEIGRENDGIHPTQKPVAIWEPCILNHTKKREILYDPFLGSGAIIIACEKHGRRAFGIELEPTYIDVIIQRFITFCGKPVFKLDGKKKVDVTHLFAPKK